MPETPQVTFSASYHSKRQEVPSEVRNSSTYQSPDSAEERRARSVALSAGLRGLRDLSVQTPSEDGVTVAAVTIPAFQEHETSQPPLARSPRKLPEGHEDGNAGSGSMQNSGLP